MIKLEQAEIIVSTHSRLKAAGCRKGAVLLLDVRVSTHSRLKAAVCGGVCGFETRDVSTHSRLKAAGAWTVRPQS